MVEARSNIKFTPVDNPVYIHPLTEPLTYGDNAIAEIAIRKPNGRDLLYVGSPIIADPTSGKDARIDFPVAYKLASSLSGIPEKILYDADPADLIDLFWKIGSFFIPGWQDILPAMMKLKAASSEQGEQPAN